MRDFKVCAATAQTKINALISSDAPYKCEIYAEVAENTMQWEEYEIWPIYNEMRLTVPEEIEKAKAEIATMSHETMCRKWRFGGFRTDISKKIGW